MVKDRDSGNSKRFAFVQFEEDDDAKSAMKELGEPVVSTLEVKPHMLNHTRTRVCVDEASFGRFGEWVVPFELHVNAGDGVF